MADLIYLLVGLVAGAIALVLLWTWRARVVAKKISFPFMEFEVSNFDSLTVVTFFRRVTRIMLAGQPINASQEFHPLVLMNAGWMMVCEAFVLKFDKYPTEENVHSVVAQLGSQNAEFVNIFRKVYECSIREGDRLKRDFAHAFVTRGPALAQRVSGNTTPLAQFARAQYAKWGLNADRL